MVYTPAHDQPLSLDASIPPYTYKDVIHVAGKKDDISVLTTDFAIHYATLITRRKSTITSLWAKNDNWCQILYITLINLRFLLTLSNNGELFFRRYTQVNSPLTFTQEKRVDQDVVQFSVFGEAKVFYRTRGGLLKKWSLKSDRRTTINKNVSHVFFESAHMVITRTNGLVYLQNYTGRPPRCLPPTENFGDISQVSAIRREYILLLSTSGDLYYSRRLQPLEVIPTFCGTITHIATWSYGTLIRTVDGMLYMLGEAEQLECSMRWVNMIRLPAKTTQVGDLEWVPLPSESQIPPLPSPTSDMVDEYLRLVQVYKYRMAISYPII